MTPDWHPIFRVLYMKPLSYLLPKYIYLLVSKSTPPEFNMKAPDGSRA